MKHNIYTGVMWILHELQDMMTEAEEAGKKDPHAFRIDRPNSLTAEVAVAGGEVEKIVVSLADTPLVVKGRCAWEDMPLAFAVGVTDAVSRLENLADALDGAGRAQLMKP